MLFLACHKKQTVVDKILINIEIYSSKNIKSNNTTENSITIYIFNTNCKSNNSRSIFATSSIANN